MATNLQDPATKQDLLAFKKELSLELVQIMQHMLQAMESRLVSRTMLEEMESRLVTPAMLEAMETKLVTPAMLEAMESGLIHHMNLVAENQTHDYNGIFKDRLSQHDDRLNQHAERIVVLEDHAGVIR